MGQSAPIRQADTSNNMWIKLNLSYDEIHARLRRRRPPFFTTTIITIIISLFHNGNNHRLENKQHRIHESKAYNITFKADATKKDIKL